MRGRAAPVVHHRRPAPARRPMVRGQAVLYVVVLSPIILLCLTAAVGLGALQMEKQRLRSALDEATAVATGRDSIGGNGHATVAGTPITDLVRQSIADNLRPLGDHLDGVTPDQVAASADVAVVVNVPAPDPFDASLVVQRPTVEARIRAPVHAELLTLAGLSSTVTFTLSSSSDLRVSGGAGA